MCVLGKPLGTLKEVESRRLNAFVILKEQPLEVLKRSSAYPEVYAKSEEGYAFVLCL